MLYMKTARCRDIGRKKKMSDQKIDLNSLPSVGESAGADERISLFPSDEKPRPAVSAAGMKRAASLSARDLLEAGLNPFSYIPGAVLDLPFAGYNLMQKGKEFLGGKPDYTELPFTSKPQAGTTIANMFGLPQAQSDRERMVSAVQQGGLSLLAPGAVAAMPGRAAPQMIAREMVGNAPTVTASRAPLTVAKETLTAPRTANVIGGGIAGATGETLRQEGFNPYAQMAGSVMAGILPGLATPRINPTGAYSELNRAASELRTRPPTGAMVDPMSTLGQIEGKFARQLGGGAIGDARAQIAESLRQRFAPITAAASESPAVAGGEAITSGIRNTFLPSFRQGSSAVWNRFDSYVPGGTEVPINNTQAVLANLTEKVPDIPALSRVLSTPKVSEIAGAISEATGAPVPRQVSILGVDGNPISTITLGGPVANSALPFSAIRQLRSAIGERLSNPSLVSDIPYADLKQLYGALSRDMEGAARASGPEAERAWQRANAYTRAGHERIENFLDPLVAKDAMPETVFNMATAGGKAGGTKIQAIMNSIGPDNRLIVSSNFLRKIALNLTGDDLDAVRFAKAYNELDPAAREALMGQRAIGAENARLLRQIAKLGGSLGEANRSMPPPTGINNMLGAILHSVGATAGTAVGAAFDHPTAGAFTGTIATPILSGAASRQMVRPGTVRRSFTENAAPRAGIVPGITERALVVGPEDRAE